MISKWLSLDRYAFASDSEVREIIQHIEFSSWPLLYLSNLITYLDNNYVYQHEDFTNILAEYFILAIDSPSNRAANYYNYYYASVDCSLVCRPIVDEAYSDNEENGTHRADVFIGCFKCCMAQCGR